MKLFSENGVWRTWKTRTTKTSFLAKHVFSVFLFKKTKKTVLKNTSQTGTKLNLNTLKMLETRPVIWIGLQDLGLTLFFGKPVNSFRLEMHLESMDCGGINKKGLKEKGKQVRFSEQAARLWVEKQKGRR